MALISIYQFSFNPLFPSSKYCPPLVVCSPLLPTSFSSLIFWHSQDRKVSHYHSYCHHVLGQDGNLSSICEQNQTYSVVGGWGKENGAGIDTGREYFSYLIM